MTDVLDDALALRKFTGQELDDLGFV